METKIISLLAKGNTGCTFVDWSILYLSGQTEFYSFKSDGFIPLTHNPVTKLNAHGHKKNHFSGADKNKRYVERFLANHQGLLTLYPGPMQQEDIAATLNLDISNGISDSANKTLIDFSFKDHEKLWRYLHSVNSKIVFIQNDPNLILAQLAPRSTDNNFAPNGTYTVEQVDNNFQQSYYSDSIKLWKELNLVNVWDERERRALDIRPFSNLIEVGENMLPFDLPHLRLTTSELWNHGESVIKRIMKFVELEIQPDRWDHWCNCYREWKSMLEPRVSFCYRLPLIVKSIVNNWYYELNDLTFLEEVVIQHLLIYKHNLNLKTWNLHKFPSNTQDLHKLLEPNIHSVSNIYNV